VNPFDPERNPQAPEAEAPTLSGAQPGETEPVGDPAGANAEPELSVAAGGPPIFRWRDLAYLVVFYLVVGVALTQVVATATLIILDMTPEALQEATTARVAVVAVSQALLSGATLAFLYVTVRSRGPVPFWLALGWRPLPEPAPRAEMVARYMLTGAGLALLIQTASHLLGTDSAVPMEELFQDRPSVLMMMALGILVAPLVEETLFRGCLYPVLARTFGTVSGIILTGALFGMAHSLQLAGAWAQVALLMAVGIFLTYVRARAGTVLASYCVHLGYNTLLFVVFYFVTGGLRNLPPR
jgi:membrane protease YdiL (CAAX protease family)